MRVKGRCDTIFCQVNGKLDELSMQLFNWLSWILLKWIFKWVRDILIIKSDRVNVFFRISEVNSVPMGHIFEFLNLHPEALLLLLVFEDVFFPYQHLLYLLAFNTEHSKRKLYSFHIMQQRISWCHQPNKNIINFSFKLYKFDWNEPSQWPKQFGIFFWYK